MKKIFSLTILICSFLFVYATPDSWIQKSSMPSSPRAGAVAFAIDGFGYAGTGLDSTGHLLNDFWKYDATNDSWSQVASFPGTPRKNAVAFVTDSFAYVGTGIDSIGLTKDFYRYDAVANSWLRIEDLDSASAVYPRRDATAFTIDNLGYVVGGYDGTTKYSNETWQYNASADTVWNERTSFRLDGRRWATSFSTGGFGFVGMGFNYSQEYFGDLWKYNPTTNAWAQVADYPGNDRSDAVAFVINGYAFAGTGFDNAFCGDFYKYDYTANSWSAISAYGGFPTSAASAFSLDGKGYVFGGIDTLGFKNELWEYTPENIVGIESLSTEVVRLYPNPAYSLIRIYNCKADYVFNLYDATGKKVIAQTLSNERSDINVAIFPRGIYYFSISIPGKKSVTGKVILE
jgi:N-acetylneuraminic acid mutarotase